MSLEKKRRHEYYYIPEEVSRQINPLYPNEDYEGWPIQAQEGSVKYSSWKRFGEKYPFNAKLLVHLFGERDAIDCHQSMVVVSEIKAASLCSFFLPHKNTRTRIKILR